MQFSLSTFIEDKNKIKKRITPTSMIPSLTKHNFRSKINSGPTWCCMLIQILRGQREADLCEFKADVVYIRNFRAAISTW